MSRNTDALIQAAIAVRALTGTDLDDQLFEVTGPRLMTFAEATQEIAAAAGLELQFVEIPHEDFVAGMVRAGVPGAYVVPGERGTT